MADGIDAVVEADAYDNLYSLVDDSSGLLDTLAAKSWVDADNIQSTAPTGASMIDLATGQVRDYGDLTTEIYALGFLDTLYLGDDALVQALIRIYEADSQTYRALLDLPTLEGDIPDSETVVSDIFLAYLTLRLSDDGPLGLSAAWLRNNSDTALGMFRIAIASPLSAAGAPQPLR